MNSLEIFKNEEFGEVRVIEVDNAPWFVAKDVAIALGYSNTSKAIIDHVEDEDKLNNETLSSLGQRGGWLINESGLYSLIMGSRLPNSKAFKKWVTSEVLPSIRKNGGYLSSHIDFSDPEIVQNLLDAWKVDRAKLLEANNKITVLEPKAEFYDTVIDSDGAVSMGEVVKLFGIKGFGRTKLFEYLRKKGVLDRYNIPYSRFMDAELFNVVETSYKTSYGVNTNRTTRVYQKGIEYIRKLLKSDGFLE